MTAPDRGYGLQAQAMSGDRAANPQDYHDAHGAHDGARGDKRKARQEQPSEVERLRAEVERLRESLQKIHDEHGRQTAFWHHRDHPTELAARWHDGYVTACATHAIEAKKALDPEGSAADDEHWRVAVNGTDVEWYERTGHCGHCGMVAAGCMCDGECGCAEAHGPRKEPYVSPEARALAAEATVKRDAEFRDRLREFADKDPGMTWRSSLRALIEECEDR